MKYNFALYSVSQKIPPRGLQFSDIFGQTVQNFKSIFCTPIISSYLHQTTNFYSVISNFNEVMP